MDATQTMQYPEDLEDGEIESNDEEEQLVEKSVNEQNNDKSTNVQSSKESDKVDLESEEVYQSTKHSKKKKSKSQKSEQKSKSKKNRKGSVDEDFAGSVEKAIRKAMKKQNDNDAFYDDDDFRRKNKKRKRYDNNESVGKKRRKHDVGDEMDENEMMCVRGASPMKRSPRDSYDDDDRNSYASESSRDSREHHQPQRNQQRRRPMQRDRKNNNKNERDRRRVAHPMQDPDGVCIYFMQGKCHKGDDCMFSHNAEPPRKMELCKFYLMDCCAKRDKCLYMHSDFPCKYYHTGLPCIYKDECKFAHGKPLSDNLKNILLKHIESAPKEILGDFPRLSRDGAMKMIQTTQYKLMQQFSDEYDQSQIPQLFDPNESISPQQLQQQQQQGCPALSNQFSIENKKSPKMRQSRWQNGEQPLFFNNTHGGSNPPNSDILSIKNLTGVLTPRQISDLTKMGIENLDQLGQLTVLQLNSIGISLKQITDIQLNTMNIQQLGLINSSIDQAQPPKDLDLRVAPTASAPIVPASTAELPEQDIDMRFHLAANAAVEEVKVVNKDTIDIDQYTKDALKFASKDKVNSIENEAPNKDNGAIVLQNKDVDHRVLPFVDNLNLATPVDAISKKQSDTDIRFLQPEPIFKGPEKRIVRQSTDDDEDNNLLIDEKWYSSDEEKGSKRKSPAPSPSIPSPPATPTPKPHVIEPAAVLRNIGDLSKIDISAEVTKLLHTMKNNLQEPKVEAKPEQQNDTVAVTKEPIKSLKSPEHKPEPERKRAPRVSIYECVDGEPTDGRRRSDVDLRKADFNMPSFGDTDLRSSASGDIDFRLTLPFKAIPNYTPASEIDGSINSHPPIPYRLIPIEIPRPDYTDIRNSTAKSQALVDPRLRKVFRLSLDESNSDSEKPVVKSTPATPRADPRRKPRENDSSNVKEQKAPSLDLQVVIQNSEWYKDLSSTKKIFVNSQIARVSASVKRYQQDKTPGKKFDLSEIQSDEVLVHIFTNLGVALDEQAEFSLLPKPKEPLLKTPLNFNQQPNPFMINSNVDATNMNMMPMMNMNNNGPMNSMGMGFNPNFADPRGGGPGGPVPGLLGIAPNMPFNNPNFGGPNFGNMPFNGPPDFGNMDGDQSYPRFPNRGGHNRGRGGERWNRGGAGGRGNRKNYNSDRGNWKNDRSQ